LGDGQGLLGVDNAKFMVELSVSQWGNSAGKYGEMHLKMSLVMEVVYELALADETGF
jgi:hypothetical protein